MQARAATRPTSWEHFDGTFFVAKIVYKHRIYHWWLRKSHWNSNVSHFMLTLATSQARPYWTIKFRYCVFVLITSPYFIVIFIAIFFLNPNFNERCLFTWIICWHWSSNEIGLIDTFGRGFWIIRMCHLFVILTKDLFFEKIF